MSKMNSKLVPLTLTIKNKMAFKLKQFFKKIEPFFLTPSNLNCELIVYWSIPPPPTGGGAGWGQGGETPVLRKKRKSPTSLKYRMLYIQKNYCSIDIPYLLEYKSHFFVPENQSKNGGATYTRG